MTMSILQDDKKNEMKKTYNIPLKPSIAHNLYGANYTIFTYVYICMCVTF